VVIPAQAIGLGFEKPYDFSGLQARFMLFSVSQSPSCGEICGSFSAEEMCFATGGLIGLRPTQVDEKPLLRFTHELVISTEAKRSGEICGSFSG
jgi:hypothetical protein